MSIWKALNYYGLPCNHTRVLQAFFCGTVSAVRHNGELSDWFDVTSGTGQGDIQGPPIFNVCLNLAAQRADENNVLTHGAVLQKAITSSDEDTVVMDTDYADDMALLVNCKDGLQELTDILCKYAAQAGLCVNAKKTKELAIAESTSQRPYTETATVDITVGDTAIHQVSNFTYLGTIISSDGTIDRDLSARIQNKAFGAYNQLSKNYQKPKKLVAPFDRGKSFGILLFKK